MNVNRNMAIDIFRLFCAILVVAIHTHPFKDVNFVIGVFFTDILTRIAVPFFFVVSGYFYYIKLIKEPYVTFKTTLSSIVKIYAFWSLIYYIRDLYVYLTTGLNVKSIIITFITNFLIFGSSYHFWYFISLILSTIVVYFCFKYKCLTSLWRFSIILYIIGLLGTSYYQIGNSLPIISSIVNSSFFDIIRKLILMGVPFFCLGCILESIDKDKVKKLNLKILFFIACFFIVEILLLTIFKIEQNTVITVGLYPLTAVIFLILLKNPLSKYERQGTLCRQLANYIYYIHPLIIWIIGLVDNNIKNTALFFLVLLLSSVLGVFIINIKLTLIRNKLI